MMRAGGVVGSALPLAGKGLRSLNVARKRWGKKGVLQKGFDVLGLMSAPQIAGGLLEGGKDLGEDILGYTTGYQKGGLKRAAKVAREESRLAGLERAKVDRDLEIEGMYGDSLRAGEVAMGAHREPLGDQEGFLRQLYDQNREEVAGMAMMDQGVGGLSHLLSKYL